MISHIFNCASESAYVFLEGAGLNLYHTNTQLFVIFVKSGSDVKEKIFSVSLSDLLPVAELAANRC